LFSPRVLSSTRLGWLRSSRIRRHICWKSPPEEGGFSDAPAACAVFASEATASCRVIRLVAVGSSRAPSDSGCSERISLSSVIGRLPKTRNPKTDRSERRPIHSARFSHLQEQRFVRLLKRGTLENDDAVGALARSQTATTQAKVGDWELFGN